VRKRAEYQEVQREARRVSTQGFVFLLRARPEASGARLGIVVSRKVGNAVVRNRAKRLIREAFRASAELFAEDLDVIVIIKRPPGEARLDDVTAEWATVAPLLRRRAEDARHDRVRRGGAGEAGEKARDSRGS